MIIYINYIKIIWIYKIKLTYFLNLFSEIDLAKAPKF